jgi:hypothetical protein
VDHRSAWLCMTECIADKNCMSMSLKHCNHMLLMLQKQQAQVHV